MSTDKDYGCNNRTCSIEGDFKLFLTVLLLWLGVSQLTHTYPVLPPRITYQTKTHFLLFWLALKCHSHPISAGRIILTHTHLATHRHWRLINVCICWSHPCLLVGRCHQICLNHWAKYAFDSEERNEARFAALWFGWNDPLKYPEL